MNTIIQIIAGLFEFVADLFGSILNMVAPRSGHEPNAAFGNANTVLKRRNKGFAVGDRALDRETSYKNMLTDGQTGSGKTTKNILVSAINLVGASLVINDPAGGEIYDLTAGFFKREGCDIHVISFPNSEISAGFNPFSRSSGSDLHQVVSTLMKAGMGNDGGDAFWLNSAQSLVVMLVELLRAADGNHCNLANVIHLLTLMAGDPEQVDYLFSKYASKQLFQRYKATIAQSDRTLSGIISTATAALLVYQNPEIATTTAFDSIDFEAMRHRPTVIYIQNPILDQEFLAPITTVFFQQLFATLMRQIPPKDALDVFFLIDEAATFKLNWQLILAQCRKFRVGCLLAVQTYQQLITHYQHHGAETIRNNCYTSLQFSNMPLGSARDLEQVLGRYTYEDERGNTKQRPLMYSDELRRMDGAILLVGNNPPYKVDPKPWFKSRFKRQIGLPAPPKPCKRPFTTPPLINPDFNAS